MGGVLISMVHFADDIVLVTDLHRDLVDMQTIIYEYQIRINSNKTIILVYYARGSTINTNIYFGNQLTTKVYSFKYLTADQKSTQEIKKESGEQRRILLKKKKC